MEDEIPGEGHYQEAAFSIVPLIDGAGTKIKVLESLAYTRTCVVTAHSISGYESVLKDGECVAVGRTLSALVPLAVHLLRDVETRYRMEIFDRQVIERNFTCEAVYRRVKQSVSTLLEGGVNV